METTSLGLTCHRRCTTASEWPLRFHWSEILWSSSSLPGAGTTGITHHDSALKLGYALKQVSICILFILFVNIWCGLGKLKGTCAYFYKCFYLESTRITKSGAKYAFIWLDELMKKIQLHKNLYSCMQYMPAGSRLTAKSGGIHCGL